MNGPAWLAAFAIASLGVMSLGPEGPSMLRGWHPRVVAGAILAAIGVAGFVLDIAGRLGAA